MGGVTVKVNKGFRLRMAAGYEIRNAIHVTVMLFAPFIVNLGIPRTRCGTGVMGDVTTARPCRAVFF